MFIGDVEGHNIYNIIFWKKTLSLNINKKLSSQKA